MLKLNAMLTPLILNRSNQAIQKHKTISDFRRENEYDDHRKKQCEADPFSSLQFEKNNAKLTPLVRCLVR